MSGILVQVDANTTKANRDLSEVNKTLSNLDSTANRASLAVASLAKSLVSLAAFGGLYATLKSVNEEFTKMNNRLRLVVDDLDEVAEVQGRLLKIARDTRGSVENTATVYSKLASSLAKTGVSQTQLLKATTAVQQAIAVAGDSAESASKAIIQLGQGLSSGTLRGEELGSVLEQLPRVAQAIADEIGVARGRLREMAETGKLTTNVVFRALITQAEKINKEFGKTSATLAQGTSKLGGAFRQLIYNLDKGVGLSLKLGVAFESAANKVLKAADAAEKFGASIITGMTAAKRALAPLGEVVDALREKLLMALPGVFVNNTIRGEVREFVRVVDDSLGGLLTTVKNFRLSYLITIESTTEKAVRAFRRLLPSNWIAGGEFDKQTFERIFSRAYLDKILANFSYFAKGLKEDSDSIRTTIMVLDRETAIVWRNMLRYVGLLPNTFVNIRSGLFVPIFESINNVIQGMSDLGVRFYEFGRLFTEIFGPALASVMITSFRLILKLPEIVIKALDSTVRVATNMLRRLKDVMEDAFGRAELVTTLSYLLKDTQGRVADLAVLFGLTLSHNATFFQAFVDTISSGLAFLRKRLIVARDMFSDMGLGKVYDAVVYVVERIVALIKKLYNKLFDTRPWWERFADSVVDAISSVPDRIADAFSAFDVFSGVERAARRGLRSASNFVSRFADDVIRTFQNIYQAIIGGSWWTDTMDGVVEQSRDLWSRVRPHLERFENESQSVFRRIAQQVSSRKLFKVDAGLPSRLKSSFEDRPDMSGMKEAVIGTFVEIRSKLEELFVAFPMLLKASLAGGAIMVVNTFLTDGFIKSSILGGLTAILTTSLLLFAEKLGAEFFGNTVLEAAAGYIGKIAGMFVVESLRELPRLINAGLSFGVGFGKGILQSLPIVGDAFKTLMDSAEGALTKSLGLGAGLATIMMFGGPVKKFLIGAEKDGKKVGGVLVKVWDFFSGKTADDNKLGFIGRFLYGTVGPARVAGGLSLILSQLGALDAILGRGSLAKFGVDFASAFLVLKGDVGLRAISQFAIDNVINPLANVVKRGLGDMKSPLATGIVDVLTTPNLSASEQAMRILSISIEHMFRGAMQQAYKPIAAAGNMLWRVLFGTVGARRVLTATGHTIKQLLDETIQAVAKRSTGLIDLLVRGSRAGGAGGMFADLASAFTSMVTVLTGQVARLYKAVGNAGLIGGLLNGPHGKMALRSLGVLTAVAATAGLLLYSGGAAAAETPGAEQQQGPVGRYISKVKEDYAPIKNFSGERIEGVAQYMVRVMEQLFQDLFRFWEVWLGGVLAAYIVWTARMVALSRAAGMSILQSFGMAFTGILNLIKLIELKWIAFAAKTLGKGLGLAIGTGISAAIGYGIGSFVDDSGILAATLAASFGLAVFNVLRQAGMAGGQAIMAGIGRALLGIGKLLFSWVGLGGLVLLALFGENFNPLDTLDKIYRGLKRLAGIKPVEQTDRAKSLGLSEDAIKLSDALSLNIGGWDLGRINRSKLSKATREALDEGLKGLEEAAKQAGKDFAEIGDPKNRAEINERVEKFKKTVNRGAVESTVPLEKLADEIRDSLRSIPTGKNFADRFANRAAGRQLQSELERRLDILRRRQPLLTDTDDKRKNQFLIDSLLRQAKGRGFDVNARAITPKEERLGFLSSQIRTDLLTDQTLPARLEEANQLYQNLAKRVSARVQRDFIGIPIAFRYEDDPKLYEDFNRATDRLIQLVEDALNQQGVTVAARQYKALLSGIETSMKELSGVEIKFATEEQVGIMQHLADRAKDIAREFLKAKNASEGLLQGQKKVGVEAAQAEVMRQAQLDLTKSQLEKLLAELERVGAKDIQELARRVPGRYADQLTNRARDLANISEALKMPPQAARENARALGLKIPELGGSLVGEELINKLLKDLPGSLNLIEALKSDLINDVTKTAAEARGQRMVFLGKQSGIDMTDVLPKKSVDDQLRIVRIQTEIAALLDRKNREGMLSEENLNRLEDLTFELEAVREPAMALSEILSGMSVEGITLSMQDMAAAGRGVYDQVLQMVAVKKYLDKLASRPGSAYTGYEALQVQAQVAEANARTLATVAVKQSGNRMESFMGGLQQMGLDGFESLVRVAPAMLAGLSKLGAVRKSLESLYKFDAPSPELLRRMAGLDRVKNLVQDLAKNTFQGVSQALSSVYGAELSESLFASLDPAERGLLSRLSSLQAAMRKAVQEGLPNDRDAKAVFDKIEDTGRLVKLRAFFVNVADGMARATSEGLKAGFERFSSVAKDVPYEEYLQLPQEYRDRMSRQDFAKDRVAELLEGSLLQSRPGADAGLIAEIRAMTASLVSAGVAEEDVLRQVSDAFRDRLGAEVTRLLEETPLSRMYDAAQLQFSALERNTSALDKLETALRDLNGGVNLARLLAPTPQSKASGGKIVGPGGPQSDSIPAMLSNGEFVVNASATRRFLPLLRAINDGSVAGFADGGSVYYPGIHMFDSLKDELDEKALIKIFPEFADVLKLKRSTAEVLASEFGSNKINASRLPFAQLNMLDDIMLEHNRNLANILELKKITYLMEGFNAGGGYMAPHKELLMPWIMGTLPNKAGSIDVMTHEFGHAIGYQIAERNLKKPIEMIQALRAFSFTLDEEDILKIYPEFFGGFSSLFERYKIRPPQYFDEVEASVIGRHINPIDFKTKALERGLATYVVSHEDPFGLSDETRKAVNNYLNFVKEESTAQKTLNEIWLNSKASDIDLKKKKQALGVLDPKGFMKYIQKPLGSASNTVQDMVKRPGSLLAGAGALVGVGYLESEIEEQVKKVLGLKDSFEWLADELGPNVPLELRGIVAAFGAALEEATAMSVSGLATAGAGTALKLSKVGSLLSKFFPKMASGGKISGQGGSRDDLIPAMLSNGEFVVNADSTRRFLPLLRAINDGSVVGFERGGAAGDPAMALQALLFRNAESAFERNMALMRAAANEQLKAARGFRAVGIETTKGATFRAAPETLQKVVEYSAELAKIQKDLANPKVLEDAGLVKQLDARAQELEDFLKDAAERMNEGSKAFLESGRNFVSNLESTTKQAFADLFRAKKQDENISVVKSFFKTLGDGVSNAIIDQFLSGFMTGLKGSALGKGVEGLGKGLFEMAAGIFGPSKSAADAAKYGDKAPGEVTAFVGSALAPEKGWLEGLFSKVESTFTELPSMFSDLWTSLKGVFGGLDFGAIGSTISGWFTTLMSFVGVAAASGGLVRGPGGPTSDLIPAMLSNGEFVMNARSARANLPLLQAINNGRIGRYADGGAIGLLSVPKSMETSTMFSPKKDGGTVINVNVTGDVSRQTRAEIAAMLPNIAEGVNMHNREKGYA